MRLRRFNMKAGRILNPTGFMFFNYSLFSINYYLPFANCGKDEA